MQRSTDRILTTHAGSLPRPEDLQAMLFTRDAGEQVDAATFAARVQEVVSEVVRQQVEAGVDIVSDGEVSKPSFASYVRQRLTGFGGENPEPRGSADREAFPEWAAEVAAATTGPRNPLQVRPMCTGPLGWADPDAVHEDIRHLRAAADEHRPLEAFIPAASIGMIAEIIANQFYPSEEAYLYALADVMRDEYEAIARAGFIVQIDAPDAAMGRHTQFRHATLEEFRRALAMRIEALNHALANVPEEQIRFHVCWGNYEGPHTHDVELGEIVDLLLTVRAGAYSVEASNPRHAHEWEVWQQVTLAEDRVLIPGVMDSLTNFVEHPRAISQRIVQFAHLVGRERVIAGTDCGFGTSARGSKVHPTVMWEKFRALSQGAALASRELWG